MLAKQIDDAISERLTFRLGERVALVGQLLAPALAALKEGRKLTGYSWESHVEEPDRAMAQDMSATEYGEALVAGIAHSIGQPFKCWELAEIHKRLLESIKDWVGEGAFVKTRVLLNGQMRARRAIEERQKPQGATRMRRRMGAWDEARTVKKAI